MRRVSLKIFLFVCLGLGCGAGLLGIAYRYVVRVKQAREVAGQQAGRETLDRLDAHTVWSDGKLTEVYVRGRFGFGPCNDDEIYGGMDTESLSDLRFFSDIKIMGFTVGTVSDKGLREIAGFRKLETLVVDSQDIEGPGIAALRRLPELKHLSLRNNSLSDYFARDVSRLPHLEFLSLQSNPIGDDALEDIGKLTKLKSLDLRATKVTDAGLARVASLSSLEELDVSITYLTDAGLRSIGELKMLRSLSLGGDIYLEDETDSEDEVRDGQASKAWPRITGAGLKHLSGLPNLRELRLTETHIGDEEIRELASFTALEHVDLSNTMVTDESVHTLLQIPSLKTVKAQGTKIDPTRRLRYRQDETAIEFDFSMPP